MMPMRRVYRKLSFVQAIVTNIGSSATLDSIACSASVAPWAIRASLSPRAHKYLRNCGSVHAENTIAATTCSRREIDGILHGSNAELKEYLAYNPNVTQDDARNLARQASACLNNQLRLSLLQGRDDLGALITVQPNLLEFRDADELSAAYTMLARYMVLCSASEFELLYNYFNKNLNYKDWVHICDSAILLSRTLPLSTEKYTMLLRCSSLENIPSQTWLLKGDYLDFINHIETLESDDAIDTYFSNLSRVTQREILKKIVNNPRVSYKETVTLMHLHAMPGADIFPMSESGELWMAKRCSEHITSYEQYMTFSTLLSEWGGTIGELLRASQTL